MTNHVAATATPPLDNAFTRSHRAGVLSSLLDRAWSSGVLPEPSLHADALVDAAGADDLGPEPNWRPALDQLTAALVDQAALNPLGRTIAYGQIVGLLRDRGRAYRLWAAHPEILSLPVTAPIVVLGQMRSGTTRLQRLLACDPRLDHTRFYESWNPVPSRPRRPLFDMRRPRAALSLAAMASVNPGFGDIHPTSPGAPDEEVGLISFALFGSQFEVQWRVPEFARWCETADRAPVYAEFKALLQTIRWLRGATEDRPWVLKVPQFTQDLDAFLEVFPDARLLCLERDPAAVVASAASLVHNQMQLQSDLVCRRWIGREWLHKVSLRRAETERVLAEHPARRCSVDYARMDADWRGEMLRIYDFLGLELTPPVLAAMVAFTRRSTRRPRHHHYRLEDFGLSHEAVQHALPDQRLVAHP